MRLIIRLPSGSPGAIAGPDVPPRSAEARVRRSSPPSWRRRPWHSRHLTLIVVTRISRGLTRSCPPAAEAGSSPSKSAPLSIQRRIKSMSPGANILSPIGIAPDAVFCNSRLCTGFPGTNAGPDLPPARRASRVRTSSSACGELSPWHATQFSLRIGAISDSKRGGAGSSPTRSAGEIRNAAKTQTPTPRNDEKPRLGNFESAFMIRHWESTADSC